jgi:hypothetical protein
MTQLNRMRNGIVHRSTRDPLKLHIQKLHDTLVSMSPKKKMIQAMDVEKMVAYATLACSGFLANLTYELMKAQGKPLDDDD